MTAERSYVNQSCLEKDERESRWRITREKLNLKSHFVFFTLLPSGYFVRSLRYKPWWSKDKEIGNKHLHLKNGAAQVYKTFESWFRPHRLAAGLESEPFRWRRNKIEITRIYHCKTQKGTQFRITICPHHFSSNPFIKLFDFAEQQRCKKQSAVDCNGWMEVASFVRLEDQEIG